ncbi:uncharacterized protein LOC144487884, partial [Mustelus asterias]
MEVIVTQEGVDDLEAVGELFSTNLSPPPRVQSDPPFDDLQPRITDPLPLEVGEPPWQEAVSGDSSTEGEEEVTCLGEHSPLILPASSIPGLAPQGTRSPSPSGPQLSPTLPRVRPAPGELDFGRPEASGATAPVDQDGRPLATTDRRPPSSPDILPSPRPNSGASEHSGSHPLAARGRASTAGSEGSAPDEAILPIGAPAGPESRDLSQARDWTSPLDHEVNEPIVDGPDAERSQLIGQEFDDPIGDSSDAEQFHLIGQELRDPIVDDPDAEPPQLIGREFADPIDDSSDAEQPHPIGREFPDPIVGCPDTEQPHPIGREFPDPIVGCPDTEQPHPIGREFPDPIVGGPDTEQPHPIGREFPHPIVGCPDTEQPHPIGREFPDPIVGGPDTEQPHPIGRDLLAIDPRPMREPLVEALDGQGPESGQPPSPGEAVTDGCPAADSGHPRDRGKVQVYFVLGFRAPAGVQEPDPARLPQQEVPQEEPPPSESRGEEGAVREEESEGEVPSVGLRKEDSFRRRSRSAPPAGSQVEGLGCAHHRRSNGQTPRPLLQRQDAISIEGGQEEEEEEGEDAGSATGEDDDGHKPLGKSNSCPSPRSGPETLAQWMLTASRGQEQLVEKRPSREWHRRGIRRPSVAIPSSRDGSLDQPEDCQGEDLQELGNTNNLEMRLSRRRSKILQSSRLLYQEYNHVALDQQLLRQKQEPPPGGEVLVEPVQRRVKVGDAPRTPSTLRASLSVPFVLWRDIPEVRRRREFDCLSQEHQKLQE